MDTKLRLPRDPNQTNAARVTTAASPADITSDLTWIDMLKGIAIIAVIFDNLLFYWMPHMNFAASPGIVRTLITILKASVGPFVQVFFILSGFGLTLSYLRQRKSGWSWKKWALRRFTKIVVPYEILVIAAYILAVICSYLFTSITEPLSWATLITTLTFTRNFYPPSWAWNIPLWYMPPLIGLYIFFPLLIKFMEKWGPWALLGLSLVLTYGSLAIGNLTGFANGSHFNDLFIYWTMQFALGMFLAYMRETDRQKMRLLLGFPAFILGVLFIACSWALRTYVPAGKVFNDTISGIGFFFFLLNVGWVVREKFPLIGRVLNDLSDKSYFMYLIHYPLMVFLIAPVFQVPINPLVVILLVVIYIPVLYYLCILISKLIGNITEGRKTALSSGMGNSARI